MQFPTPYPQGTACDVQEWWTGTNTRTNIAGQPTGFNGVWNKPPWARLCFLDIYSPGGGGGGGFTGPNTGNRGGGGGGGSGIGYSLIIPAWKLPQAMIVVVGLGGAGAAAGGTGTTGGTTALYLPGTDWANFGVLMALLGGAGGAPGTVGTGGGGGTGASGSGNVYLRDLTGQLTGNAIQSANGSSGGATGNGASGASTNQSPLFGGNGGGGANTSISSGNGGRPVNHPHNPQVYPQGGTSPGGRGEDSVWYALQMLLFNPAGGGAGNFAGTAGDGGNTLWVSGGPGGGGGTTGGRGGKGGDGFIIITSW